MKKKVRREVECTIPVVPVSNLARSLSFYSRTLGFKFEWRGGSIGSVARDGCSIMLREENRRKKPAPVWVWIGLESDALFKTVRRRRVQVLEGPANRPWAYEMLIADPDGNVLWLGTEPKANLPMEAGSD